MNNQIHDAFVNAALADAAYVEGLLSGMQSSTLTEQLKGRLTESLAKYVGDNFSVVTQYTDPDNSGFSVTVFADRATGQKYVSLRGTEPSDWRNDFATDADAYLASGLAKSQIISMVNWYLRATALRDTSVVQLTGGTSSGGGGPTYGTTTMVMSENGALVGAGPLIVDGHSLGGHLTTVFTRIFNGAVLSSDTYNGLGVGRLFPEYVLTAIQNTLGLGPTTWESVDAKQNNYYAGHGINTATTDWWLSQRGQRIALFNEEQTGLANHGMYKLTDMLALADVMGSFDSNLLLATVDSILNAASATSGSSLEAMLDAFRKLVGTTDQTPTQIGDAEGVPSSRVDFHQKLAALRGLIQEDWTLRGTVIALIDKSAADLLSAASNVDGIAHRYALKQLNPFAVLGIDYSRFNTNHELDLINPDTGEGSLSTEWLTDRAAMLAWKMKLNTEDFPSSIINPYEAGPNTYFEDKTTGEKIVLGKPPMDQLDRRFILFGKDTNETLNGTAQSDRLYGMAGNDVLNGSGGADYLEGGSGDDILNGGDGNDLLNGGADNDTLRGNKGDDTLNGGAGIDALYGNEGSDTLVGDSGADILVGGADNDTLNGGAGLDTYLWTSTPGLFGSSSSLLGASDDGADQIIDSDKRGRILINGTSVKLLIQQDATTWTTPDGKVTLTQTDGLWKLTIDGGGSLDLGASFSDGDYGIYRSEITTGGTLIRGDLKPIDHDITTPAEDIEYDSNGNVIVSTTEAPGREDRLYGSDNADTLLGLAGNDILNGRGGNDLIEGGNGSDILIGDAGNDTAWGDAAPGGGTPLATALTCGASDSNQTTRGDWVDGQSGDDILVGTAAEDLLTGGIDNDLLIGGAGDDLLLGDVALASGELDWSVTRTVENDTIYRWTISRGSTTQSDTIGGADVLHGGRGEDWLIAGAGDDLLDGGADADVLFGEAGNDVLLGGTGNDVINGDSAGMPENLHGADWIDGGEGNDRIFGMAGDDILIGGGGDDTISGGAGRDTYIFNVGDGIDRIVDASTGAEASILVFGEGFDKNSIKLKEGSLLLDMGNGDAIHIDNWDQTNPLSNQTFASFQFADGTSLTWEELLQRGFDLDGTDGDDTLVGTGVADRIDGRGGDDFIYSLAGNDILTGGTGTDGLSGGAGDDTYLLNAGDSPLNSDGLAEVIIDQAGTNTVEFGAGIAVDAIDTELDPTGRYLFVSYGAGDKVAVEDGAVGNVADYRFADGQRLGFADLIGRTANTVLSGTSLAGIHFAMGGKANDVIESGLGGALISGGRGNDTIVATGSGNTYFYSIGDGTDHIRDSGAKVDANGNPTLNRLKFGPGVFAEQLRLTVGKRDGMDTLAIRVGDDPNDVIHMEGFIRSQPNASHGIDLFEFEDGVVLDYGQLLARGFELTGTAGDDVLVGTGMSDRLSGGDGNDHLEGGDDNDSLSGGHGADSLSGGGGDDVYYFARGDGQDTLYDSVTTIENGNTINCGPGISQSDLVFARRADGGLYIGIAESSDGVTLPNWYGSGGVLRSIQKLVFEDGSTFDTSALDDLAVSAITGTMSNDDLAGTNKADTIVGLGGDDVLHGGYGNDVLMGGAGNDRYVMKWEYLGWSFDNSVDTIIEAPGETNTLQLQRGMYLNLFRGERLNDDLWFHVRGGENGFVIKDYYASPQDWQIRSSDGSLTFMSAFLTRADQVQDDLLQDAWGDFLAASEYNWRWGHEAGSYGECYQLLSDGRYYNSSSQAALTFAANADIRYSSETRLTADGSYYTFDRGYVIGTVTASPVSGSAYLSERYEAFGSQDFAEYTGYKYPGGNSGRPGQVLSRSDNPAVFQMQWGSPEYHLQGSTFDARFLTPLSYYWDEALEERVPIEWIATDVYRTTWTGGATATITGVASGGTTADPALLANALAAAAITQIRAGGNQGTLDVALPGAVSGVHSVEQLNEYVEEYHAGPQDDVIYTGDYFAVDGGGGNDVIISNRGDAGIAFGGDGNDRIFGGSSMDVLNGGNGDDYLGGGGGNDTYLVVRGQAGHDVIDEAVARYSVPIPGSSWSWTSPNSSAGSGSTDTIRFGAGITLDDLRFSHGVINSRMADASTTAAFYETVNISWAPGESIHIVLPNLANRTITSAMMANPGSSYGIEQFRFADGSQVSMDEIQRRARDPAYQASPDFGVPKFLSGNLPRAAGTEGDDWLYGSYGAANYIEGLGGDDHIYGNNLGDYLSGDEGNDYIEGGLDADILNGGGGNDTLIGMGGDVLIGGTGNDRLIATGGGNTFAYNLGDGTDVIVDTSKANGANTPNVLVFGSGISSQSITLGLGSLLIRINGEEAIHIDGFDAQHPFAVPSIDQFLFADGSSLAYNDLLRRGFDIFGTDDGDTIAGTAVADRITGGAGNDILAGGAGDDRYIYRLGDGSDRIADGQGNDTLFIDVGMSKDGFEFDRIADDLIINLAGTGDFITLDNWYLQDQGVGRIEFGDGSFLARTEFGVESNLPPVANADSIAVQEDGGALSFAAANLLANDTDPNPGDVLTVIGVGTSQVGATVTLADGQVSYDIGSAFHELAKGETVHDSFSYTITDSKGAQASSLVNVDIVGTNDAPVTAGDTAATLEDAHDPIAGNVLANDSDVDNGTVLRIAAPGDYLGAYGRLALAADGSYAYALDNAGLAVQSLASGTAAVDHFAYAATDGITSVDSALDIAVLGANDAPVTANDADIVVEDWLTTATGNVLTNDPDIDHDTVLQVAEPGAYAGEFGSLSLGADGRYTYTLDNAAAKVQSLGREAAVVEHFGYTASDGQVGTGATLDVFLHGTNDAPMVVKPLTDHDVTFNKRFSWQMPADSFTDVDAGDVLTYTATQADGAALPDWLHFDTQTLSFSGMSPKAVMSIDVRVTATDKVAATGSTVGSLSASDVFTLSIGHGNEGVGNGQDAAPAGQTTNFNDGAGTSPGNPGAKGGNATATAATGVALASEVSPSDVSESGSAAFQVTPSVPAYLGLKDWQQYAPAATSGTASSDAASIFARWLAVDLAVSQALAGKEPVWLDDGLGADTAALNKATSGYLGATQAFGTDAFSLLAGSGHNLQNFKGLAEGVQKIA